MPFHRHWQTTPYITGKLFREIQWVKRLVVPHGLSQLDQVPTQPIVCMATPSIILRLEAIVFN